MQLTPTDTAACLRLDLHQALYQGSPGDPAEILKQMDEVAQYREANQPIKERTGGSCLLQKPAGSSAWKR